MQVAKTLLRAGNAIAFKALQLYVPVGGGLVQGAQAPIDNWLESMFDDGSRNPSETTFGSDPVFEMGERFVTFVEQYLESRPEAGDCLVVCVDDLDRCLPSHQVAMLEAIYFLTRSRARAYFVVALDPTLIQEAVATHYGVNTFDTGQYLDKLFDLRVTLRALRGEDLEAFLSGALLSRDGESGANLVEGLASRMGIEVDDLLTALARIFSLPELANPRLCRRVITRLHLFGNVQATRGEVAFAGSMPGRAELVVRFCVLAERWPEVRRLLQGLPGNDDWAKRLQLCSQFYRGPADPEMPSADERRIQREHSFFSRLPSIERFPDLEEFLDTTASLPEAGTFLRSLDREMRLAAL